MPELRRPIVAVCMYMKSSFKRDAAACPADCCPSAACFLPGAARCPSPAARRLLPAFCCVPPAARRLSSVRQVAPACRFAWRAALSGISGIAAPALFPAPSCCSCLFLLLPAFSRCSRPPPPRAGTPRKSNGASVVRMRRRWGICLPLFGEFSGSPASVGLGPQP